MSDARAVRGSSTSTVTADRFVQRHDLPRSSAGAQSAKAVRPPGPVRSTFTAGVFEPIPSRAESGLRPARRSNETVTSSVLLAAYKYDH